MNAGIAMTSAIHQYPSTIPTTAIAAGTTMFSGFVAALRTSARLISARVGGRSTSPAMSREYLEERRDRAVDGVDVVGISLERLASGGGRDARQHRLVGLAAVGDRVDADGKALGPGLAPEVGHERGVGDLR